MIALAVAALISPFWGLFTILVGRAYLLRRPSAPRLVIAVGFILIAVNLLYLVTSAATAEGGDALSLVALFYLARAGMGAYLVIAGMKIAGMAPSLTNPA